MTQNTSFGATSAGGILDFNLEDARPRHECAGPFFSSRTFRRRPGSYSVVRVHATPRTSEGHIELFFSFRWGCRLDVGRVESWSIVLGEGARRDRGSSGRGRGRSRRRPKVLIIPMARASILESTADELLDAQVRGTPRHNRVAFLGSPLVSRNATRHAPRATPAAPASARPLGPAGDAPLLMTSESTCTASRGPTHLPLHTPGHGGNYLHAPGISRSILHCQIASLHPAREPEQPEPTRA